MDLHSRGTRGFTVEERLGIQSKDTWAYIRGTPGYTQSRDAWAYSRVTPGLTVEEHVDLQSRNALVYTVAERMSYYSRGTPGYTQSRNSWGYTVAERLGLQSRNAWV